MRIGFIGLGVMGGPMAINVCKAGHEVHVFDMVPAAVEKLVAAGAIAEKSSREVAEKTDIVITMLPNSPHVKAVILGENGVLAGRHDGLIIIDMSSIAPLVTKEVGAKCAEVGVELFEAPVSGGEAKAIDGTLNLMCGGTPELLEKVRPILETMAANIVLCGELGAGNTTKLVNQHIIAVELGAIAEAFVMGKKAGVDPEVIYNAIHGGAAGSFQMDAKLPQLLKRNFKPGFRLNLHIKDLNNAIETGHSVGAPMPLASAVMDIMKYEQANGNGNLDHSIMMTYFEKLAGAEITK